MGRDRKDDREEEKYRAQGLNDFIVYSIHALGSFSAGVFITLTSWKLMNFICIPFMILIIFLVLGVHGCFLRENECEEGDQAFLKPQYLASVYFR